MRYKFTQNERLAKILARTDGLELHEATSDKKWGTRAELSSKVLLNGQWEGQDLLGQTIEKVCEELIAAGYPTVSEDENLSENNSQAGEEMVDDLSPIPDYEGDGHRSENENEAEITRKLQRQLPWVVNLLLKKKGKETTTVTNIRGNQCQSTGGTSTPVVNASISSGGRPKKKTKETSLSADRRTVPSPRSLASDTSFGSPISRHSLIQNLSSRMKCTAPAPPRKEKDSAEVSLPPLR